jgi:hypothetical protein
MPVRDIVFGGEMPVEELAGDASVVTNVLNAHVADWPINGAGYLLLY